MTVEETLERVEGLIGYTFEDPSLLRKALTHPSAVEGHAIEDSYERLEFLGDALLGSIVSVYLYEHNPEMDEGNLTRAKTSLVSGEHLSRVADGLGLGPCIFLGESEHGTHNRGLRSALENVYEALCGAIFLDGGRMVLERFVRRTVLAKPITPDAFLETSPKSLLQEFSQQHLHKSPAYQLVGRVGPPHAPTFTFEVYVGDRKLGVGEGSNKKEAEKAAARVALEVLLAEFETSEERPCT